MPKMSTAVFAAHMDNVLKLARRKGGVSRPEIISELNVSRTIANSLIEKADLKLDRTEGRTEFFVGDGEPEKVVVKQSVVPPEAQAVATPVDDSTGLEEEDADLADLDAQIVDTRNAMREAAAKCGKAMGEWATHQALVDALRERMTELATKRMNSSS